MDVPTATQENVTYSCIIGGSEKKRERSVLKGRVKFLLLHSFLVCLRTAQVPPGSGPVCVFYEKLAQAQGGYKRDISKRKFM